jgi:site-specific DNA-methyltransferase (cytosine-N4-specific)
MTRLSTLHAYPAMIADDLAVQLSSRFVTEGMKVLDPFCGTGRTLLAAAEQGANCTGIDINPLAVIVTRAKAGDVNLARLKRLSTQMNIAERGPSTKTDFFDLEPGRKVNWFSRRSKKELKEIICWLNDKRLRKDDKLLLAAILSATAREASFCRQDQWKLHRIQPLKRAALKNSPWSIFTRRCKSVIEELTTLPPLRGKCSIVQGDSRDLRNLLSINSSHHLFDLVITSPPYGDSHTTVGYGGISGICLGVIEHLGLCDVSLESRSAIDRLCLGGRPHKSAYRDFSLYWHGGIHNSARRRVNGFLIDMEKCCKQIATVLRPGGRVVFVVARRTVSGYRVYLDLFIQNVMAQLGFILEESYSRSIKRKNTPYIVDRSGKKSRTKSRRNRVMTMRTEYILAFCHNPDLNVKP